MKNALVLFLAALLGIVFAVPAPQQITINLGESFDLRGADTATFDKMTFRLESVNITGDSPQVMVALTTGESEEADMLLLELPAAASIDIGEYTLTLLGATVPADAEMSCAVSTATLILEKTEKPL
jgi:hypothetical protein